MLHQIFHDVLERALIARGDVRSLIAFYEGEYEEQKALTQSLIQDKLE